VTDISLNTRNPSVTTDPAVWTRSGKARRRRELLIGLVRTIVVLAAGVLIWHLVVTLFDVKPIILPKPLAVWEAWWTGWTTPGLAGFAENAQATLIAIVLGFIIGTMVGLLLGFLISQAPIIDKILYPYIAMFNAVPKVAIAPLFVLWFGFGLESKVFLTVTVTFFPIMINSMAGFRSVEKDKRDLFRSIQAGRLQTFRMLTLPAAMPFLFAALEVGIVYSIISAIVGEFVGAQRGLGVQLLNANNNLATAAVFAILLNLALLGLIALYGLRAIRKRVLFWEGGR
jgi:NitT/TauT family transport system permease protein